MTSSTFRTASFARVFSACVLGAVAFSGLASASTAQQPAYVNPNVWYRLTTLFQGPNVAMDVINDGNNNRMHMVQAGPYTGQYWRFTPIAGYPGYYRISCLWQGENLPIDVINGGSEDNQIILAPLGLYSGQFWQVTEEPTAPGHVRLTTMFRGPGFSLEGFGGTTQDRPRLDPTGPYTGQLWKLTPIISIDPAATTPFGTACSGRLGVPDLHATGGTGPWIGETMTGEVTNVPSTGASELIIGTRLSTPIDLGFINSPGCLLRVSLLYQGRNAVAGGRATFALPILNEVALVGLSLPIQCSVIDPGNRPFIAMSNGLELRFGLR
ncbi:MAG: hypothetical protein R3F56_09060 [Planctomycetota bacterium]